MIMQVLRGEKYVNEVVGVVFTFKIRHSANTQIGEAEVSENFTNPSDSPMSISFSL